MAGVPNVKLMLNVFGAIEISSSSVQNRTNAAILGIEWRDFSRFCQCFLMRQKRQEVPHLKRVNNYYLENKVIVKDNSHNNRSGEDLKKYNCSYGTGCANDS